METTEQTTRKHSHSDFVRASSANIMKAVPEIKQMRSWTYIPKLDVQKAMNTYEFIRSTVEIIHDMIDNKHMYSFVIPAHCTTINCDGEYSIFKRRREVVTLICKYYVHTETLEITLKSLSMDKTSFESIHNRDVIPAYEFDAMPFVISTRFYPFMYGPNFRSYPFHMYNKPIYLNCDTIICNDLKHCEHAVSEIWNIITEYLNYKSVSRHVSIMKKDVTGVTNLMFDRFVYPDNDLKPIRQIYVTSVDDIPNPATMYTEIVVSGGKYINTCNVSMKSIYTVYITYNKMYYKEVSKKSSAKFELTDDELTDKVISHMISDYLNMMRDIADSTRINDVMTKVYVDMKKSRSYQ